MYFAVPPLIRMHRQVVGGYNGSFAILEVISFQGGSLVMTFGFLVHRGSFSPRRQLLGTTRRETDP